VNLTCAAASDPGLIRVHNEDRYCTDVQSGLLLVVDGVGGQNAGEVAAEIICSGIEAFIRDTRLDERKTSPFGVEPRLTTDGNRLRSAILMANRQLSERLAADQTLAGMAATMAAVLVGPTHAAVANVGDCRTYLLRDELLEQMTIDHSWVAEQVRAGTLDPEQARSHPMRNLVTRAVSGEEALDIDIVEFQIQPGDLFLVCSDGLCGMLTDEEIQEVIVAWRPDVQTVCNQLVSAANLHGGRDNITVVVGMID
jgi:protein phosphatase